MPTKIEKAIAGRSPIRVAIAVFGRLVVSGRFIGRLNKLGS